MPGFLKRKEPLPKLVDVLVKIKDVNSAVQEVWWKGQGRKNVRIYETYSSALASTAVKDDLSKTTFYNRLNELVSATSAMCVEKPCLTISTPTVLTYQFHYSHSCYWHLSFVPLLSSCSLRWLSLQTSTVGIISTTAGKDLQLGWGWSTPLGTEISLFVVPDYYTRQPSVCEAKTISNNTS